MGLGPQNVSLTLSLWLEGSFKGFKRVVELGSQDLHVDAADLTREMRRLTKNPDLGAIKTPKALYQALGFEEYRCIDTDGRNEALVFDLNESIKAKGFTEQFDLVTNHGTTEHCFDQGNAFRNIHNLCAKNGLMIHALPFQGYLNHGFYNYHPNFYRDLAQANNYELAWMLLSLDALSGGLSSYSKVMLNNVSITSLSTLALVVVLRKTNDEEFKVPFQGKYAGASLLAEGYEFQRVPAAYLDLNEIAWEISGRELFRILLVRTWRKFKRMLGFRRPKTTIS